MYCHHCLPRPGLAIEVDKDGNCLHCKRPITSWQADWNKKTKRWDKYFHSVCIAIASKSPCLSRQIGAILVRDKSIVATGYNGPARGYPHCKGNKFPVPEEGTPGQANYPGDKVCPRRAKGYKSGEGLVECPAAHAEGNCIANAARIGASTVGTTLYMNCIVPCKDCMIILVNAGVVEVAVEKVELYHEMSAVIARYGGISIRELEL